MSAGWENFDITETLTGLSFNSKTRSAFIGGGQVGYNYQVGPYLVLGVEGFIDGVASNNNTATFVSPILGPLTATANTDWVATVAGRVGFTGPGFDHWLIYGKGGGGWVQNSATISAPGVPATFSASKTFSGWLAGGGIEWAFAPNWTARIDYQYIGLENTTIASGLVLDTFATTNANVQTLTVGVNYLFNWGATPAPVVTRY